MNMDSGCYIQISRVDLLYTAHSESEPEKGKAVQPKEQLSGCRAEQPHGVSA